jgi:hypothetical protein
MPSDQIMNFAIPEMFKSMPQKAILSEMLWTEEGSKELIEQLRVYDMIRRFYIVRTGIQNDTHIKYYFENIKDTELYHLLLDIAKTGQFPLKIILDKKDIFLLSNLACELLEDR